MRSSTGFFLMIVLSGFFLVGPSADAFADNSQIHSLLTLLEQMESSYSRVEDYTAVFLKQERVEGRLLPEETILIKFQKPFKVYLKWIKAPHLGREALYVQGKYDNKVIAHEGGFLGFVTLSLDPREPRAMKGNRHPITDGGLGFLIDGLVKDVRKAAEHGELEIVRLTEENFNGRPSILVETRSRLSGARTYYAARMVLHVDKDLLLPIGVQFYDKSDRLFERYAYTDLRLNTGLTSMDFDRNNPRYHF